MEMTALLDEMAPPQSPGPEQSSALEMPPEVKAKPSHKKRKAAGCMEPSFGQPPRSPSPPPEARRKLSVVSAPEQSPPPPPALLLSPRRATLQTASVALSAGEDQDKGETRPSKLLRMQMRRSGKGMNGGSSAHNASPLQRTLSVYVPFERPDDVDPAGTEEAGPETLFAQSHLPALRTPPREVLKLHVDAKFDLHMDELAPFESRNLDFDFEQFTMSD